MPILDVEIVVPNDSELEGGLAGKLADAAGKVFGSPAGQTWVRLRTLPGSNYAENGGWPVFVTVLKARIPPMDELKTGAKALAAEVGRVCQRPQENVHILYLPKALGRIAFGGNLRTD